MADEEQDRADWPDRLEVIDALYRFGAGVDFADRALLASAFDDDALVDFGPCGRKMELGFSVVTGSDAITSFLAQTSATQTTTHVITNGRAAVTGNAARLRALVDATHIPKTDPSRCCRMLNWYEAELSRHERFWRIRHLVIDNAWFTGDPQILIGR